MVFHNRGVVDTFRGDLPAALSAFDEAAGRYRRAGRTATEALCRARRDTACVKGEPGPAVSASAAGFVSFGAG